MILILHFLRCLYIIQTTKYVSDTSAHIQEIYFHSLSQNTISLFIKVFGDLASISIYQVELEDSLNQSQVS